MAALPLLLALACLLPGPGQDPARALDADTVAAWDGGRIGYERFDRFLARTHRGKPAGNDALHHILQLRMVEWEAGRRGLVVSETEAAARIDAAREQVEERGLDFKEILADRGLTPQAFERLIRASLLHEQLVLQDRAAGSSGPVTPQELIGWTETRIAALEENAVVPGPGAVFEAEGFQVTERELGRTLRQALPELRLDENLRQLALQDILAAWAARTGAVVTEETLEAELDWRRGRVAENPVFAGATYEGLLAAQGSSLEQVRSGLELRTAGLLRMVAEQRYPDSWFEALDPGVRAGFAQRFGESRLTAWLLLRSVDASPDPLDLTHAAAAEELQRYAAAITSPADFQAAAQKYSEHEPSRVRGGVLGWIHREEPGIDPAVAAAAFAAAPQAVAGPVATREGRALVMVLDTRPAPSEAEFRDAVRRSFHRELREDLLAQAGLQTAYQSGAAGPLSR